MELNKTVVFGGFFVDFIIECNRIRAVVKCDKQGKFMVCEVGERPGNWEDVCVQCGLCCLVKIYSEDGDVFLTKVMCDHLDRETRKCDCYSADFDKRDTESGGYADYNI